MLNSFQTVAELFDFPTLKTVSTHNQIGLICEIKIVESPMNAAVQWCETASTTQNFNKQKFVSMFEFTKNL